MNAASQKRSFERQGKETKLIQSTNEQIGTAPVLPPSAPPSPERGANENASTDRSERKRRRLLASQSDPAAGGESASASAATSRQEARRLGRAAGQEQGKRRNARGNTGTNATVAAEPGSPDGEGAIDPDGQPEADVASLLITDPSASAKKSARAVQRHQKKQQSAEAAVAAAESDETNPSLGALNRHLNMMMQQLATAHRVIGRTSAERDALRQQLADLKGVPVEEIHVSTIGIGADEPAKAAAANHEHARAHAHAHAAAASPSAFSKLNYFSSDVDYAVMRRRRQRFVFGALAVVLVLWVVSRFTGWAMPTNLSKDSLGALPFVGDLMSFFLAGWLMYRVVRVSAKGVRWVFPSDDPRRRRH
jgi:hypothetical protein